jgi:lysylphosphatidylglycerol synthetase-like protein (DUF2156 family)
MASTAASARGGAKSAFARALDSEQVVGSTSSRSVHRIGALVLAVGFVALVYVVARDHVAADWRPSGRLAWSLSLLAAVMLLARGIYLGRPVTGGHGAFALGMVLVGIGAHLLGFGAAGDVLVAASGAALMWPLPSRPGPGPESLWPLIRATRGDALAPFTMGSSKTVFFNGDLTAALAYRTRLGFAVVSGDPVGRTGAYRALVQDFAAMCASRGWRVIVLSCGERCLHLWRDPSVVGHSLMVVPVGRDVVVDVPGFSMSGRKFRNLRQAVARTHNRGITTEVVAEQDLSDELRDELAEVVRTPRGGGRYERGFSMMLDRVLVGRYPGVLLIVGRDRAGTVQAFHRYVVSGGGSDVSLDLPWRRPGAPNGIDERLTVDMIAWCQERGARRFSLAFAAFPELFDETKRTGLQRVYYLLIRLGGPLIRLESLYRYLRKFHALGQRRYVLVPAVHLLAALVVLLSLEFLPHRSHGR